MVHEAGQHHDTLAPLRSIDLFCGAGGLACGLTSRGFDVRLGSDIWKPAADTYRANFPGHRFEQVDIRDLTASDILEASGGTPPDLVAGGPPCQGFSSAGARAMNDERNTLVGWYSRLAAEVRSPVVVFENVEGFLTASNGKYVVDLFDPLIEAGYVLRLEKLNVANFGVPQLRKRVIVIAALDRTPQRLVPTNSASGAPGVWRVGAGLPPTVSAAEALSKVSASKRDPLSLTRTPGDLELARIQGLEQGKTMRDLPPHLQHKSWLTRANRRVRDGMPTERRGGAPIGLRRLRADEPSKAITGAATREFVHPTEHRTLTLREAAALQTFPDTFEFVGSRADIATMIGNAIPPKFAAELASAVHATLAMPPDFSEPGVVDFRSTNAEAMSPALARVTQLVEQRYGVANSVPALF